MPKLRADQSVFSSKESDCVKTFCPDSAFSVQQRPHTGKKPPESNTSVKTNNQPRRRHRCGRTYQCKVCGKAFKHTQNLYLHHRTHTGEKPYECKECKKLFSVKSNLSVHQKTHTGEKPYECNICGNAFKRRCDLTIHQRVHTGEKPYECKECRKAFSIKSGLIVHQRIHTGEKPYECGVCGKRFNQKSNLSTHEKIHTGEKPFECKECSKSFSVKSYLTIHLKTHSGEKPHSWNLGKPSVRSQTSTGILVRTQVSNPVHRECRRRVSRFSSPRTAERRRVESPVPVRFQRLSLKSDLMVNQWTQNPRNLLVWDLFRRLLPNVIL